MKHLVKPFTGPNFRYDWYLNDELVATGVNDPDLPESLELNPGDTIKVKISNKHGELVSKTTTYKE